MTVQSTKYKKLFQSEIIWEESDRQAWVKYKIMN